MKAANVRVRNYLKDDNIICGIPTNRVDKTLIRREWHLAKAGVKVAGTVQLPEL